jgi:hypothetical protein
MAVRRYCRALLHRRRDFSRLKWLMGQFSDQFERFSSRAQSTRSEDDGRHRVSVRLLIEVAQDLWQTRPPREGEVSAVPAEDLDRAAADHA